MSSVTVYVRLYMMYVCVSRSVCTYDSMYLDEMQRMCAYENIMMCAGISTRLPSRLDSVFSNDMRVLNDDESLD